MESLDEIKLMLTDLQKKYDEMPAATRESDEGQECRLFIIDMTRRVQQVEQKISER